MTHPADRTRKDWWRLGAVGVVAVLLSLIGFSVASRYQPSTDALPPLSDDTTSTSSAPTTTAISPLPVPTEQATTTTVDASESTALALSEETLDFSESEDSLEVSVTHVRGGPVDWELVAADSVVTVDPGEGSMEAGESIPVAVSLDRSQIDEGEFQTLLTLTWGGGEATATVIAVSGDNPIIHNPRVSPSTVQVGSGSGCSPTRATVSARVRDTSEIEQVIARWSPDGSATRETAMNPVGNDTYEGVIGPYETTGSDSVKVVAFDVKGNAGGAFVSLAVVDCG